ncbi:MAG TPA: DUF87 domain-containing protein [archaeon]|nr:DUF87 domain-containing protein [archaeon]
MPENRSSNSTSSNVRNFDIKEEIKRLIPFLGKEKATRLEAAYFFGDENYRKKIIEIIDGIKAVTVADKDLSESVLIEPPPKEVATKGSINIGQVLYGKKEIYPLNLDRQDFLTHVGIFGSSGSGKTNIIHHLVRSLNAADVPILIFDFSKRNYRDLLGIPELKDKVTVYTVGRNTVPFRFNPLVPPEGVQVSQWAKEFAEVFDHAYWLLGGGRHIILRALGELYDRAAPSYPKIQDITDYVNHLSTSSMSSRERNWVATATRPLESLCFRETAEIFDIDRGLTPDLIFQNKITILELDALSNDDKTFFIEIMLQWIRDWLLASNRREKLTGVIILEEAHHVLNREKTRKLGIEAVTDLIFREIRELGIGMIYVDQHPSMVSYPALGNTSTHVYMNLGLDTKYSSDIQDAAHMLGLKEGDVDYLRRLPTGHAFVLIRKSSFPNAFLVKFPHEIAERGKVDEKMLRETMEKKILDSVREQREEMEKRIEGRMARGKGQRGENFAERTEKKKTLEEKQLEEKIRKVTSSGWRIMEILQRAEGSYTSQVARQMKMSNRVFKQEVERMVKIGFVRWRQAKVYKQKAVYYFLTHDAELAMALKNGKLPEEGKVIDDFAEKAVDRLTKMNYDLVERQDENGRVVVSKDEREQTIIFATTSSSGKLYNAIKEGISQTGNELYFVCASDRIKNALMQQAAKYSFQNPGTNFTIFASTLEKMEKGDKAGFEKVEFSV